MIKRFIFKIKNDENKIFKRGGASKRPATSSEIMLINDNAENLEQYGEKYIDTGAGFLLSANQKRYKPKEAAPEEILDTDLCDDCGLPFENSYLRKHYGALVCDDCKDDEKYPLMTLSEVKTEYLLNDNMLKRDPALRFILKKNPHNPSWGEMKLFLLPQDWVDFLFNHYEIMDESYFLPKFS